MLQNVLVPTPSQARAFPTGRLSIRACRTCGFVWNAAFDPARIDYSNDYNNSVQASETYLAHQNAMARRVLSQPGELHYLEIGCGEGEFIEHLDSTGRLTSATGFDPAFHGQRAFGPHITIHPEYFSAGSAAKIPAGMNIVCSRHTIEHVPDPRAFITDIAELVRARDLRLFLETPDVSWILENLAFEDFFYEHCSLFSPQSMRYLLAEFGLVCEVAAVYGDQYMWIEARTGTAGMAAEPDRRTADMSAACAFEEGIARTLGDWQDFIRRRAADGPVAVWGAASKGVTFALLMEGIDCAVDLNAAKQGGFMPVSAIPILAPEAAMERGVRTLIVMNPNYETEIRERVQQMGWDVLTVSLRRAGRPDADPAVGPDTPSDALPAGPQVGSAAAAS
ncbi:class I SAM-dependent methyltransferase [Rhizobium halophytocola]|uniref:class I SAM-dependent methyltransferase n=1 Tax=Rhizobium halophytocola TaxID=735519 RepID=UPI001AE102C0